MNMIAVIEKRIDYLARFERFKSSLAFAAMQRKVFDKRVSSKKGKVEYESQKLGKRK